MVDFVLKENAAEIWEEIKIDIYNKGWNAAIEEAAQFNDSCGYNLMAREIRKLKK